MELSQKKFKWANFGIRWGALLIDFNIVILAFFASAKYAFSLLSEIDFKEMGFETFIIMFSACLFGTLIFGVLIRSLFESSKYGGTPGKIAVGIKIVDYEGNRITFSRAIKRNLAKIISSLVFYAGYIRVLFSEERQGLHDVIAKTYVVRKD